MSKKGYWMAMIDVRDPEVYKQYIEANAVAFAKYGAKFPVRAGRYENPEGPTGNRHVLVEFDSYDKAGRMLSFAGISAGLEVPACRIDWPFRHR